MDISDIQNEVVQIENYQATFLTLKIGENLFRFDFKEKKEFKLKKGAIGQFTYFENHPLLIDYNENIFATFINSKPDNIDSFINDIKNAIEAVTKGWRDWTNYVENKNIHTTYDTFVNNVQKGLGKLIEAPFSITETVIAVCDKHNVLTKTFGNKFNPDNYKLILIGDNYIIAKEFREHINEAF